MSSKPKLHIDWCSHEAAKFAVMNWHYSKRMPKSKLAKFGVWEDGEFVGAVVFGYGATINIGKPYGLKMQQICELVRVAMRDHVTPVSRVLAICIKILKRSMAGIRLIVSYADADQNHTGSIYQANGWIYIGLVNKGQRSAFIVNGKSMHPRTVGSMGGVQSIKWVRENLDCNAKEFRTDGKHKYLYPLDKAMRKQIKPLAKPYPKRAGSIDTEDAPVIQTGEGGAVPTPALK